MRNARFRWWAVWSLCVLGAAVSAPAVAQSADLAVLKNGPGTASAGSNVTYTITLLNNGPDDAANAHFDDTLPVGMTFVSTTQNSGPTFTCSDPGVGNGGVVTCSLATFTNGASATFSVVVNIPGATAPGTQFTNSVSTASDTFDPDDENNQSVAGTLVPGNAADVGIGKTAPSTTSAGSNLSYTITINSNGPNDATTVSWSDTLPGNLTFVSFTQNSGPTFNCGTPGASVTCTLATFPAGTSATFTYTGNVPAGTPSGTVYTNTVSVKSDDDTDSENDTATTNTTVSSSDIGVIKSAPATAVAGGPTFDYTITLSNGGPDPAFDARFHDALPPGINFMALTQISGPTASCITPAVGANGSVDCNISTLFNGQSAQFTITVQAAGTVANGTLITNVVSASSDSQDSNSTNNTASASTTISTQTDVAVNKTGPAAASAGTNITYALTVSNNGTASASAVSLSDALPPGETFVSITQNTGPTFNCTGGATVTCNIATLAAGASATFSLVASIGAGVSDGTTLTNTANVSSTTPDTNSGNNSSSVATTVQATADLVLAKTGPATVTPGSNASYTLSLTNTGPASAANVSLTDPLPAGETFVSIAQTAGPAFVCTTPSVGTNGTVTCTNATLSVGASASFTLVAKIPAGAVAGSMFTNTASASSSTADPNGGNSSASASANVVAAGGGGTTVQTPMLDLRALLLLIASLLAVAAWRGTRRVQ